MVLDFGTHRQHSLVEYSLYERSTATASCNSFCAGFDISNRFASAVFDYLDDIAFCDIMAGADLYIIGTAERLVQETTKA